MTTRSAHVVVITGAGGMGLAIARRIGSGSTILLADFNDQSLEAAATSLTEAGFRVVTQVVDVSQKESVEALAAAATALGSVAVVVHTAGLSPVQAPVDAIMQVDLLGTALVLDAFGGVVAPGGAGVFISSMAGAMASVDANFELRLATTPTMDLLGLPELVAISDSATAYTVAKRANQVRVRAASLDWGQRGARVNTISPGVISTPMGAAELEGASGEIMRTMIAGSGTGRIGTPEDIAAAVDFLTSRDASFITGTDLLVDGGVIASIRTPRA